MAKEKQEDSKGSRQSHDFGESKNESSNAALKSERPVGFLVSNTMPPPANPHDNGGKEEKK
jgi:hypothetical protein